MENKVITSVSNQFIKDIYKLKIDKTEVLKKGLMIVEGTNNIDIAKKTKSIVYLLTTDTSIEGKEVIYVSQNVVDKLSNFKNTQDTIAIAKAPQFLMGQYNKIIVLEDIQDPGNLGTIIRTAYAFGFDAVFISKQSCFKLNYKVVNSSQGAIFEIPVHQIDLNKLFEAYSYNIVVTSLDDDSIALNELKMGDKEDYAIIFGNEGRGVSKEVSDIANTKIKIPMTEQIDSLNISIAAAITMYSITNN